jgi:hypothetical protein
MRRGLVFAAILGVLAAGGYLAEALRYPWGTPARPGPGFFPTMVAALLFAGALGTGLEALLREQPARVEWPRGAGRRRTILLALATVGYVVALPFLGHPIMGSLLTLAILRIMEMRQWRWMIPAAILLGVGSHVVFSALLGVPLPAGVLLE